MGNDVLGDTAPQDAVEGAEATGADDDRIEAALRRDPLDRPGRIAQGLEKARCAS
jgi:hypothetical protein